MFRMKSFIDRKHIWEPTPTRKVFDKLIFETDKIWMCGRIAKFFVVWRHFRRLTYIGIEGAFVSGVNLNIQKINKICQKSFWLPLKYS